MPGPAGRDLEGAEGATTAPRGKRDFTSNIRIGREVFEIATEAGRRKTVLLPWEKIRPLVGQKDLVMLPGFRKLKGKVLYGGFELLSDMRLSTILRILPRIDPEKGILDRPGETPFTPASAPAGFSDRLQELLRPCRLKKRARKLGFTGMLTDGQGNYWFKGSRNYLTALKESLYSLETLADAPEVPDREEINALYRTLSRELEEL